MKDRGLRAWLPARLLTVIAALLVILVSDALAGQAPAPVPIRLALQGPKLGMTGENFSRPGEREMQCLALYLRNWLGSTPGVLVMDAGQYSGATQ